MIEVDALQPGFSGVSSLDLDDDAIDQCVGFVYSVGFEERARFVPSMIPDRIPSLGLAFDENQVGEFDANMSYAALRGSEVAICDDLESEQYTLKFVENNVVGDGLLLVDISSMSRSRLASVVLALAHLSFHRPTRVGFLYATADHSVTRSDERWVQAAEPVHPLLAGWPADPADPLSMICGLGDDFDLGIGAVEFFEPSRRVLFVPRGLTEVFDQSSTALHQQLSLMFPRSRSVGYDVADPVDLFFRLEAAITRLLVDSRLVIVPLGPKIFALAALLAAVRRPDEFSIWRISTSHAGPSRAAIPTGTVVGIEVEFGVNFFGLPEQPPYERLLGR